MEKKKAPPFYEEQSMWPFAHATCMLALYIASRNIVLSLLLMFAWETYEVIASKYIVFFVEDIGDALIGDPLVGALAVFTAWMIDQATGWDDIAREEVGLWRRWICIAIIALLNTAIGYVFRVFEHGNNNLLVTRAAVIFSVLLQVITIFAFYGTLLDSQLGPNIVWWLLVVFIYGLSAAFPADYPSAFIRVVVAEILVLLGNFIVFVFIQADKGSSQP